MVLKLVFFAGVLLRYMAEHVVWIGACLSSGKKRRRGKEGFYFS